MPKPYLPASFTFLALLILATNLTHAQNRTQTIDPVYVSIADGLSSPNAKSILQDSYGLLWIATSNGLQKYDGYRFETFKNLPGRATTLQNNDAWGLLEDADRNIWVGTSLGVSRYDRRTNEFKNYLFPGYFNVPLGPPWGTTFRIFQDSQKRFWAVTRNLGLIKYNPKIDNWQFADYEVPGVETADRYEACIGFAEDAKGGLWFGSTNYGLMHQANGDSIFRPVQNGTVSKLKLDNAATYLHFDATQTLWITSRQGVHKYNPETGAFKTLIAYEEGNDDVANHWNKILPDKEGNIWVANNYRGILKFEGASDAFTEIQLGGKMKMRTHGWNITLTNFIIDQSGIFWFGSVDSGLIKYDPVNKPFQYLSHDPANPNSLSKGGVFGIVASKVKPGIVYVGTRGNGVTMYDPKNQTFDKITFKVVDDMFGGSARAVAEKEDGGLWLGTWGDGLVELDKNYKEVRKFKYDSINKNSLSHNQVRVVKPDKQNRVWLGTNNGINILNTKTNTIKRITNKHGKQYPDQLIRKMDSLLRTDQKVASIEKVIDNQNITQPLEIKEAGTYWVMAVAEMDLFLRADFGWIENAAKDTVWKMSKYEEALHAGGAYKNRIVLGSVTLAPGNYNLRYRTDDSHAYGKWNDAPPTQTTLYGIALLKAQAGDRIQTFEGGTVTEKEELYTTGSNINDIEITDKYIWVAGESSGIDRIDAVTNQVKTYTFNPDDANSLSHNNIRDIHADSRGMIWFATNEGVTRLDPATETFTRYSEIDGLPTNLIEAVQEGDNGEMWIATQNGLSQMVNNEKLGKITFINYNSTDGIGSDVFLSLTTARATDGRFYFGGDHGLTTFSTITSNNTPPAIVISNLLISNISITDLKDSPLTESLLATKNISLAFHQNNLSFEFAALHYANPKKNQYAHMLEGYDRDWIYDNRNFAAYTNLDPGKYTFKVRAANAYGIWNEEGIALEITILPPWWRTWWAYAVYFIVFAVVAYATDRTVRRSIKLRERERSRERELKQAKEIERAYTELKATQSQLIQSEKMASLGELTAGIAHEIQNPLNFVNNFAEVNKELIDELKQEIEAGNLNEAKTIADTLAQNESKVMFHGKRADSIVKGMLQHSRASSGQKEPTDINELCDEYLRLSYHGLRAKDKSFNATFKTDFDPAAGKVNIVPQDIGRVVLNLLTNAFYAVSEKKKKFGANAYEPTVSVSTKAVGGKVVIQIQDNGSGIPESIAQKIFQPFFTTKPAGQGTGLGLSLSYDIVTVGHAGNLTMESKEGEGSTFILVLPVQ